MSVIKETINEYKGFKDKTYIEDKQTTFHDSKVIKGFNMLVPQTLT